MICQAGDEPRTVRARAAIGDERDRLWARWSTVDKDLDAYAARRTTTTPVVVLEPVDAARSTVADRDA